MTLDCEVVTTRSGAQAMRDRRSGEVMHPVVGPREEAERLYLEPSGLRPRLERGPLVLLDVGLGAGSNAVAAWRFSELRSTPAPRLEIVSFERDLSALRLALEPEHAPAFDLDGAAGDAARNVIASGAHM